ncbi:hypothetical protein JEQ12_015103 [Ovis aries]|uniref:Uncharacterized protein n=1 Tax=Ovis aries TaxID=9940 RepID=A0A836D5N6_SHEEP|nr:hypothetical protein JEQ12_015103 [Ovis aries]
MRPEEGGAAGLGELRSWWEVPAIAHFCSLFRTAFRLPDFEIELLWVPVALPLVAAHGLVIAVASLTASTGSGRMGCSSCNTLAPQQ